MKRALEPGEKTILDLYFKPDGKLGDVTQGVRVATNDPKRKELTFRIIGRTKRFYWVDRSDIAFTDLQPDESREVEVKLFSSFEGGFEVLNMKCEPESITARTEALDLNNLPAEVLDEAQDAKSAKKLIFTCPKDLREFDGSRVRFALKHGEDGKSVPYEFLITGSRLGRIGVHGMPLDSLGRMKFGQLQQGVAKKVVYAVKVRGDERELKVKSIQTTPPGVLVAIDPVDADSPKTGLYRLTVEFPASLPEQSHFSKYAGKIELEFENPLHKKLEFKLEFAIVPAKVLQE